MKTLLALMLTLGLSFSAIAGNEGPQAAPRPVGKLVAELVVSIPFAPPSVPGSYRYQINDTGYTQVVTQMRFSQETKVKALAPYSAEESQHINSLVQSIVPGELYDPNPEMPGCYDAPTVTLRVYTQKGAISISQRMRCKLSARVNASEADEEMIDILNKLSTSDLKD
jgi:hypothetical protein